MQLFKLWDLFEVQTDMNSVHLNYIFREKKNVFFAIYKKNASV